MLIAKQKYILLLVFLLFPAGAVNATWSEPSGPPPQGNVPPPIYTVGSGQPITGSLVVTEVSGTGLQVTGNTVGIQGNSINNAVYGNTTTGGSGGYAGIYGTAFDNNDFAGNFTGGAGIAVQGGTIPTIVVPSYVQAGGGEIVSTGGYALGGDVVFNNTNKGLVWQRLDGQWLRGVYASAGALTVKGYGAGLNFTDQNGISRLTISEAGATNVVTGPLTVAGVKVCLKTGGDDCPAATTPTLQAVTTAGNSSTNQIRLIPLANIEAWRVISSNYSPVVIRNTADSADLFRVDQAGNTSVGGSLTVAEAQIGAATGGLKGAGTLNSVQLCIQGDCRASWSAIGGASGWTDDGTVVRLTLPTDKVGIGTVAPTTKLELQAGHGDTEFRLFSDLYGQGLNGVNTANLNLWASEPGWTWTGAGIGNNAWISDAGGITRVTATRGGSYIRLLDNSVVLNVIDSAGTDRNGITIDGAGNVGIGVAPGYKLDVSGEIRATTIIHADNNGAMYFEGGDDVALYDVNVANTMGIYGQQDSTQGHIKLGSSGPTISGVSGNLGIGTTAPGAYKLNVNGAMALQGNAFDATDSTALYLNTYGDAQIRIDANNDGVNLFKINNGANSTVFTVNETGDLTVANDIYAVNNKSIRIDANNDTNLIFGNFNGNGGAFTYNGTYDLNLAVEGDVKASQFCFGDTDCRTSWSAIGGASGWTDDGTVVRLTLPTDNVGIGTVAPAGKLHVEAGNIVIRGDGYYIGSGYDGTFNDYWRIFMDGQATNAGVLHIRTGDDDTEPIYFEQGTNVRMAINNAGNVGIGTAAPGAYKLNVNGAMALQGNAFDATDSAALYLNTYGDAQIRIDANELTAPGVNTFKINNGANSTVFTVNEAGDGLFAGTLTVANDIFMGKNKAIRSDADEERTLIVGNFNGNGGAFTYGGTYNMNVAVEGNVKANGLCIEEDCRTTWAAIEGAQTLLQVLSAGSDASTFAGTTAIGGNVGIGTTDPSLGGLVNGRFTINSVTDSTQLALGVGGVPRFALNTNADKSWTMYDYANNSWLAGITQKSGNVGIGHANPGYPLHIMDNNATSIANTDSNDATSYWTGLRVARQGSEKWFIGIDASTDNLLFRRAGAANDMTISTAGDVTITNGAAAGGYAPSVTHKVTTPTFYAEQGQIGAATGGLKGAGALNAVQLCIQGDCKGSWASASPTPNLQAVTTAGKTTNLDITAAGLTSTANLAIQGSVFDATNAAALYVNAYGDAQIRIDANELTAPGANTFKINNGANSTVFTVNETGDGLFAGNLHVTGLFSAGADLAEEFATRGVLEPGTVVVMGENGYKSARPSGQEYDQTVLGVVSDSAGVIMGRLPGPDKSVIALVGVVKVKVVGYNGDIEKGDLLTTSNQAGYAMKAAVPRLGTIIGKALESFAGQKGEIMALINLQ